jgi:site-specific recombinase XerC
VSQAENPRDKAIISLFSDSGLRLAELASIRLENIDWDNRLVKVWCKGKKEGLAPFGMKTEAFLKEWLSVYTPDGINIWGADKWAIVDMLRRLRAKTGLPCNAHTFRRSFASILAKRGGGLPAYHEAWTVGVDLHGREIHKIGQIRGLIEALHPNY